MRIRLRQIVAGLGVAAIATIAIVLIQGETPSVSAAGSQPIVLPRNSPEGPARLVFSSPAPVSGLGHAQAPDPEALRDAPARQATYDAEAKPGEFVTPPNVSIEH
jgi:hypothetical protein